MANADELIDPPGAFGHGIAVGVAIMSIMVHIGYVAIGGDWSKLYADLGGHMPFMTRMTISMPWQLGVPTVGAIAIGALVIRRPRGMAWYLLVAAGALVCAACSVWFPSAPLTALAGHIQP